MTPDFHALCRSLLQAIDAGNLEAEESVLCRIRVAVREAEQAGEDAQVDATTAAAEVMR